MMVSGFALLSFSQIRTTPWNGRKQNETKSLTFISATFFEFLRHHVWRCYQTSPDSRYIKKLVCSDQWHDHPKPRTHRKQKKTVRPSKSIETWIVKSCLEIKHSLGPNISSIVTKKHQFEWLLNKLILNFGTLSPVQDVQDLPNINKTSPCEFRSALVPHHFIDINPGGTGPPLKTTSIKWRCTGLFGHHFLYRMVGHECTLGNCFFLNTPL